MDADLIAIDRETSKWLSEFNRRFGTIEFREALIAEHDRLSARKADIDMILRKIPPSVHALLDSLEEGA